MRIEALYALSLSSVTGVKVGPQVEETGPQVEIGPKDSAEVIP